MKAPLSVIILTYNEEINLEKCLKSIRDWVEDIFIIDSYSKDKTLEIAKKYGAKIKQRLFDDYATQFNWGLDNLDIKTEWVMKLDADEWITPELRDELIKKLPSAPVDVSGFMIKRRVYFMGRWIKHGGIYPTWILRVWRKNKGRMEARAMDEHTVISGGRVERLKNDFVDENRKGLSWFIEKHNKYANREVKDFIKKYLEKKKDKAEGSLGGGQIERKRWLKENVYYRLPPFLRPYFYFMYRYFIRLGFLDGIPGLIFHVLQGFWYRFLVDSKIYEEARKTRNVDRKT